MDPRLDPYRSLLADVYELAGASRGSSDRLAVEVGHTAARWHVMSVLADGPRTVPAVARRLGLARQSVQRVVNDLAADGAVALGANPDHERSPLVSLTDAGRRALAVLFERSERSRSALLDAAGVSAEELDAARDTLRRLLAAFGEASS